MQNEIVVAAGASGRTRCSGPMLGSMVGAMVGTQGV